MHTYFISFEVVHCNSSSIHFPRYYEMDDAVIREVLGKKLSSRHRKDLDEVIIKLIRDKVNQRC